MRYPLGLSLVLTGRAHASSGNGFAQVLEMLEKLKANGEQEKQDEAVQYKGFETWCTQTKAQLGASVDKLSEQIESSEAETAAQEAKAEELSGQIAANSAEIHDIDTEIADRSTKREGKKNHFISVKSDYETSITAIDRAISTLKAQPKNIALAPKDDAQAQADPSKGADETLLQEIQTSTMPQAQKEIVSLLVTHKPAAYAY